MHELHLMKSIVKMVEAQESVRYGARPITIRLRVSALSHLHGQDSTSLGAVFSMASQGTVAEGASIELISVPASGICTSCGYQSALVDQSHPCQRCGAGAWRLSEQPEVVLQDVVIEE